MNNAMYRLEERGSQTGFRWAYAGHSSGSMSDLRDLATLQNTEYRIMDGSRVVAYTVEGTWHMAVRA